jgi:hypothetical protein
MMAQGEHPVTSIHAGIAMAPVVNALRIRCEKVASSRPFLERVGQRESDWTFECRARLMRCCRSRCSNALNTSNLRQLSNGHSGHLVCSRSPDYSDVFV